MNLRTYWLMFSFTDSLEQPTYLGQVFHYWSLKLMQRFQREMPLFQKTSVFHHHQSSSQGTPENIEFQCIKCSHSCITIPIQSVLRYNCHTIDAFLHVSLILLLHHWCIYQHFKYLHLLVMHILMIQWLFFYYIGSLMDLSKFDTYPIVLWLWPLTLRSGR